MDGSRPRLAAEARRDRLAAWNQAAGGEGARERHVGCAIRDPLRPDFKQRLNLASQEVRSTQLSERWRGGGREGHGGGARPVGRDGLAGAVVDFGPGAAIPPEQGGV